MNNELLIKKGMPDPLAIIDGHSDQWTASLDNESRHYFEKSFAKATLDAYKSDARIFCAWCKLKDIDPRKISLAEICNFLSNQSSGTLSRWIWIDKSRKLGYLAEGAPLSYATVYRRYHGVKFSLRQLNRSLSEEEAHILSKLMHGIANENAHSPRKVTGLYPDDLKVMFKLFDLSDHIDLRDRAILMLLFAGAFRRSELAQLKCEDVEFEEGKGIEVTLRQAKRKVNGMKKSILASGDPNAELCPVRFLIEYLKATKVRSGPLFCKGNRVRKMILGKPLTGDAINKIVKRRTEAAGLIGDYAGHSGRRGFINTAANKDKNFKSVMQMTGHKSVQTLQEYFETVDRWKNNAGSDLY